MITTPISLRKHIAIVGDTNAGKSTLFNLLVDEDIAIVSEVNGTTTDPITKAMELVGYGPVVFIDTAGMNDSTSLGEQRIKKTLKMLKRCDLILNVCDINSKFTKNEFKEIPYINVITKSDLSNKRTIENAVYVSLHDKSSIEKLRIKIIEVLKQNADNDESMIEGVLKEGDIAVAVIPIDSEAPKGRLILPQVMFLRECLDHNISVVVTNEIQLSDTLSRIKKIDLVVCDSQIFKFVSDALPTNIKLTSFSMLLARQKGDFELFKEGAKSIENLKDGDIILMAEACTHSKSHEDIGLHKIPNLLRKVTGKDLKFEYSYGFDFPNDIEGYSLICHCGGCMINKTAVLNRLQQAIEKKLPITNYGVLLAKLTGVLDKTV